MDKVIIATTNSHKLKEFSEFFQGHGIQVLSLADFEPMEAPEETGKTFLQNAEIKARYYAHALQLPVLSDDSGLVVKSLNGEPGVKSARYSGENASALNNNRLIMKNLQGITERSAHFHCVLALCIPQEKRIVFFVGKCYGQIIDNYHDEVGFGYDPLFKPEKYDKTFAQLSIQEKNIISHRGIALHGLDRFLKSSF